MNKNDKQHLGDDVYVRFYGHYIVITKEDNGQVMSAISLNPEVSVKFIEYIEELIKT